MENNLFAQTPNTTIDPFEAKLVMMQHFGLMVLGILLIFGLAITYGPRLKNLLIKRPPA